MTAQGHSFAQVLDLFYVLLALSVIISVFGMINTLVLAVFERTRELGMLRAVGMTRRQTRRMIRHESIVTALIGAALGLPLGVLLAALATRALGSLGIGFHRARPHAVVAASVLAGLGSSASARSFGRARLTNLVPGAHLLATSPAARESAGKQRVGSDEPLCCRLN